MRKAVCISPPETATVKFSTAATSRETTGHHTICIPLNNARKTPSKDRFLHCPINNERATPPRNTPQACPAAGRTGSSIDVEARSGPEHAYTVLFGGTIGYQQGVGE